RAHFAPRQALLAATPALAGGALQRRRPLAAGRREVDAVDRAGRQAQLAADAPVLDHRVHVALRADDRVDRAGVDAARAADARCLIDHRHGIAPRLLLQGTRFVRASLARTEWQACLRWFRARSRGP